MVLRIFFDVCYISLIISQCIVILLMLSICFLVCVSGLYSCVRWTRGVDRAESAVMMCLWWVLTVVWLKANFFVCLLLCTVHSRGTDRTCVDGTKVSVSVLGTQSWKLVDTLCVSEGRTVPISSADS